MSETGNKKVISIKEVKELLNDGKSRIEIAAHFGVPVGIMKAQVWSDSRLKGLKTKKTVQVLLVEEDTTDSAAPVKLEAEDSVEEVTQGPGPDSNTAEVEAAKEEEVADQPVTAAPTGQWVG